MITYNDHQCTKCGRRWSTKYFSYYVCPGCTRVPRLRGVWLRLKYRLLGKTWGYHRIDPRDLFLPELYASELKDPLDANIERGTLVSREYESDSP